MPKTIAKLGENEAKRVAVKFEAAKTIREALDRAREAYGCEDWDESDLETEILELVTAEDAGRGGRD